MRSVSTSCGNRHPYSFFTSSLLFFTFMLSATYLSAQDYYWVNGSGAWSDYAGHWAKVPNPTGMTDYYTNVPGSTNDVYFGFNGGVAYTVNVDAGMTVPKCKKMDWSAVPAGTVWGGSGSRIDIYGSTLLKNGMNITFSGEVHFIAFGSMSTVFSDAVHFPALVFFEGIGGGWNLSSDFYCDLNVLHTGGTLNTNGYMVTIYGYFLGQSYPNNAQLNLSSSIFKVLTGHAYFRYLSTNFNAGTSHINLYGPGAYLIGPDNYASEIHFYDVSFWAHNNAFQWASLDGTLTFHAFGELYANAVSSVPILNNVVFLEGGTIYNAFDYHHLTLTAGKVYTVRDYTGTSGSDQTILPGGTLTALGAGSCSEFITIRSWEYGTHFNFVNNSGTNQTIHCVILTDCHASGTNTLTVNDGVDLGNNTGWIFQNPHGAMDLYWVGGAGDWDDACHWTTNPVGTAGDCNCVPNGATNVRFTDHSGFIINPGNVRLAAESYCNNMDWTGVVGNPTLFAQYTKLYIYGTAIFAGSNQMSISHYGNEFHFRASGVANITTGGNSMGTDIFEGNGIWTFLDDFDAYYVSHRDGIIWTNAHTLSMYQWNGNKDIGYFIFYNKGAELWLGDVNGNNSTVNISEGFFPFYEPGLFHALQSNIFLLNNASIYSSLQSFWNVTTLNNNYIQGAGSFFHHLKMQGEGQLSSSHSFETLTLTGGHGYTLDAGTVQTISAAGALNIVNTDCANLAYIFTTYQHNSATISKTAGLLNLDHVIIDGVYPDITTGATYAATNSIGLQAQVIIAWNITNPTARNLYWVGGNGDWNDSSHWSLNSGGAAGACPPTPVDNVFFNNVSGFSVGDKVSITQNWAFCHDMDWTGAPGFNQLYAPYTANPNAGQRINIFGSMTLVPNLTDFGGSWYFRANHASTITCAGNTLNYWVNFWNEAGDWTLVDDFSVGIDVVHYYGKIKTANNADITIGRQWYGSTTGPLAELRLGNSTMTFTSNSGNTTAYFYYAPGKFSAGTSTIIFETGYGYNNGLFAHINPVEFYNLTFKCPNAFLFSGIVTHKLIFEQYGYISSYGSYNAYIHEAEFHGDFTFNDSRNYHSIKFFPGKHYTFLAGTTDTIVPFNGQEGQFIAQGLPGQYIEMKSTDFNTPAIIHKDDYDGTSTCTKYLFLTAMKHTGTEDIYVPTPGGNVFNNTGWQFFPCNPCPATIPVLDPASITVGCPPGKAKLMLAGLKPDEWAIWYSDPAAMMNIVYNGGQPGPMGNMFMPTITGPATYYARVYSDGGLCESTVILTVNITTTTPPLVFNLFGGGVLCTYSAFVVGVDSSQIGVQYQLLFNGNPTGSPLAGTGDSIIFPYQGLPGTYTVQAFIPGTACSVLMNGSITPTYSPALAPLMSLNGPGWVCEATSITVYENYGDAVSWAWSGPAGFSSNAQYPPPILNVGFANAGRYTCVVTGANGCTNITSIDIAVIPKLQASLNVTPISCSGAMDGAIEVVASGGILPYSYNWIIGGQTTPIISNLGPGFYVVQVIDSSGLCESTLSANLSDPPLTDVQATPDISLCAGAQSPGVLFSSQSPGVQFHWTNNNTSIGLAASGNGNIPAFTAMNSSGSPNIAVIVVTPSLNGCVGAPDTFSITVNAMPTVVDPADQVVCNGSNTALVDFIGTPSNVGFVWTNDNPGIGLPASGAGDIASFTAINTGNTPQTATISVTPTIPGFAYIPNTGTNDVSVVNTLTNTVVATIPVQNYPIGVSATPGGSRVYVTNTFSNTVSVINTATNTVIATVPVGDYPHGLRVSPDGSKVYVANEGFPAPSYTISVISTATNVVTATITVDYSPASFRFSPDGSKLYVANRYADNFSVINTATNTVITTVSGGDYPYVMGVLPDGTQLYIANLLSNDVSVVNTATNTVTNTIPVGDHPVGLDVSPDGSKVYVSNYNANTVSIINTATNTVVATVPVGVGPHGVNVGLDGSRIYVAQNGSGGSLSVINAATNVVEATIPVGSAPRALGNFLIGTPCAGTPQTFTITVNPSPTVNQPANQVVCHNAFTTDINFGGTPGAVYRWTNNTPSIGLGANGVGTIFAFTATNTSTAPLVATITVTPEYTANGLTCLGAAKIFTITVNPKPYVDGVPNQSYCNGATTSPINFVGTVPGTVFNWINFNTAIGLGASGTGNIPAFTATNTGTTPISAQIKVQAFYTNGGLTCPGNDTSFQIRVNPTPTVNQPVNQVICNNNLTNAITFAGTATLYRWTNNTPSIGLAATGVGDIAAFNATNTGNAPLVATITVTPEYTANGLTCLGAPKTFSITVNPTPNVSDPADQVVCAGQLTTAANFSGTVTGTVFTWTNNNPAIGLGASGTGNIAAFTAINAGNTPVTATIIVTSSYTNAGVTCSGSSQTFTITVNPLPAAFNISGQTSYCSPGDPGAPLGLSGSQIGVNYQLWQGASPAGAPVAGTGAALNFGYFPAGTYTVVATQAGGGCSRTMTGSVAVQAFNCTVTVTDPCVCKNNATNLVNGQFDEFIKVNAPSWQNWTIKNIFGLYNLNSPAPPAAPIPVGTTLAGIGNNMFLLNGLHVDAVGYSVTVSNGFTDLSLPLTKCYYPDPVILDPGGPYCLYSPDVTLSAKVANNPSPNPGNLPHFTVNGTNYPATFNAGLGVWETTYDITALGNYTVGFSFDAGSTGPNNPNDPGCVQAAEPVIFNVIATPASLSCNDLVYVSLDADCTTEITPDMILEGTYNCYDDYQVNIYTNTGLLVGDVVTADHLGQTLVVKIKHLPSGNICWGNLIVQDKIAPDIQCQGITIPCIITDYSPTHLNQLGLAGAYPTVTDCSNYTLTFVDVWHNLTCDSNSAYVVRTWTAKDTWGNSSSCNQYIYFRRVYLPEVKFPADVTLSCENANTTPQNTGTPYIDEFGLHLPLFPEVGYCEFSIAYQDQLIPVCDGTHKILRHWILLDWCLPTTPVFPGPNPVEYTQIIKVLDVTGPVITCPTDLTVSTDPNNCCATVNLPDALVKDGCSRTNNISAMVTTFEPYTGEQTGMYSVGGTLTNFPGNNFWDLDTLGNWGITPCLPIGNHVVVYTAQDDCGNTGTCSFHLTVRDLVPPIAVCDQYTVAAVTNDDPNDCYTPTNTCSGAGVAWVTAKTFDDGSTDNCSNLHLTVRRMAPYSGCITQLNDCEKVTATAESDSIKFYCCEVGSTQTVILRAYQVDVSGNPILDANGDPIFNECMVNVEVQDKVKPVCQAPNNTTVSCENFDPTLWGYGLPKFEDNCCLDTTKTYQNHCGLTHSANYTLFDTICNRGTITRTFRVWDCHGQTSQCVQRVVVQYEQDYYVKFPNDVVVNTCNGSGNYGVPVFFGKDCEQLGVAYEDHIVTLVPEACYRIERTWYVVNLCTYNANLPYTYIPNPRPNNAVLNPANLPGPIVSAPGTLAPWAPTVVKINPTDAAATNYSIYWSANVNGYEYKQQIYINDTEAPALNCPASPVAFCDLTPNDPELWNDTYWWDNTLGIHDLCEGPVDLSITTTDSCSGPNVNVWYRLYLDLDGDGQAETLVNSANAPAFGTIQFGNLNGPGTSRVFDTRPVAANQKWGFAIEQQVTGSQKTARVRWNTAQSTTQYVMPELPYGTHKIEWTVSDGCGNDRQCAYDFTVKDCKKPTVVCLNGLSVNIMPTQMVQLWASDFLKYTEDNCTPASQLKIGIRKSGTGTGFPLDANGNPVTNVIFTCDELGTQLVEIWSMDKAGNADFCETYVLVQDNNHNCPTVTGAKVAGKLATEASDGVESGAVEIAGSSNAVPSFNFATMTDNAGAYNFNAIPLASNSTLTPNKDDNPLNGVSTYDLVLISKHILGIEALNSPYKMIAADANKSGSITTFDIVEIRKLILGIYSELPYNTSWRFVDKDFVFPNPANPFETQFSENKLIQNLNSDRLAEDFVSVKVGDVNGTAIANALMGVDERSAGTLLFDIDDRLVQAGETFTVMLTPAQMTQGYQFTLNINGLDVLEVDGLKAENYAVFKDAVTFSVDGAEAQNAVTLTLKATKGGKLSEMLSVSSRITKAEAYGTSNIEQGTANIEHRTRNIERYDIALRFNNRGVQTISGVGFELYQNQPNPFVDKTVIGFYLPYLSIEDSPAYAEASAGKAQASESTLSTTTLTIFDETGRILHTQQSDFPQGYNRFILDGNKLPSTGILYYRVETATDRATMKMIRLR